MDAIGNFVARYARTREEELSIDDQPSARPGTSAPSKSPAPKKKKGFFKRLFEK